MENLYDLINLDEKEIFDEKNNINFHLKLFNEETEKTKKVFHINKAVEIVNKFHSYFHFEQSFFLTLLAYYKFLDDQHQSKTECIERAIFQDHTNHVALEYKKLFSGDFKMSFIEIFSYNRNINYEKDFIKFAVGRSKINKQIENLDNLLHRIYNFKNIENISICNQGIINEKIYYQRSHRYRFAKSVVLFFQNNLKHATEIMENIIQDISFKHTNYHNLASNIYKQRSDFQRFLGNIDLANNDLIKAVDLISK